MKLQTFLPQTSCLLLSSLQKEGPVTVGRKKKHTEKKHWEELEQLKIKATVFINKQPKNKLT